MGKKKIRRMRFGAIILLVLCYIGVNFLMRNKKFTPTDTPITIKNIDSLKLVSNLDYETIQDIAISPNGKILAIGLWNGVAILDTTQGKEKVFIEHLEEKDKDRERLSRIAISTDGKFLVTGSFSNIPIGTLKLWNVSEGKLIRRIANDENISMVAFNNDNSLIVYQSTIDFKTLTTHIIDVNIWEELLNLQNAQTVAFSPTDDILAYSTPLGVYLWNTKSQSIKSLLDIKKSYYLLFSPNGKRLLSLNDDNTLILWDIEQERKISLQLPKGYIVANSVFDGTGDLLVSTGTGSNDEIIVWNATTGMLKARFGGHTNQISAISFAADSTFIATGGFNGDVILWNTATGEQLKIIKNSSPVSRVMFSPNGTLLIVELDISKGIHLWGIEE